MIPDFLSNGNLPQGIHETTWDQFCKRFGNTGRVLMKKKYKGDLFPAEIPEGASGKLFLEFFQTDKITGEPKGIIALEIGGFDD